MSASLSERCRQDSEIAKSLTTCDSGASPLRDRDHVVAVLEGECLWHAEHPYGEDRIPRQGVNRAGGSPQIVLLNFDGLSWFHVAVARLTKVG